MTRFEAWLMHAGNALVGGTGLVYAWMRYFMEPAGEFAVVNHPWQPTVQHLHILGAPILILALGPVWTRHAWPRLRGKVMKRRRSGILLMSTALPMIFSGYLLQTSVSEFWRTVWIGIHVSTSLLWLAGILIHLFFVGRTAKARWIPQPSHPPDTSRGAAGSV